MTDKDEILDFLNSVYRQKKHADGDVVVECPKCGAGITVYFYGSYHQSFIAVCPTKDCLEAHFQGL